MNGHDRLIGLIRILFLSLAVLLVACNDSNSNSNSNTSAPLANAGLDQTTDVIVGDVVVFDGSGSSDADGHTLSYLWSFVSVPLGSAAVLDDPTSEMPTFPADLAGTYVVQLMVSDGALDSAPDEVTVVTATPAPTVTITKPTPLSLKIANPVTFEGTVDDPMATITVNGTATTNNNGNYSTDIDLVDGGNTVTVIATNSTGQGEDSVFVVFKSLTGPVMTITSHRNGFTVGEVWDGCGATPTSILTHVHGTMTTALGPPTIMVNGVTANIGPLSENPLAAAFCEKFPNLGICGGVGNRYSFSADIQLAKGQQTITATGFDTASNSFIVEVSGVSDYCHIAEEGTRYCEVASILAERGNNQNNVCHAIDGCSVPTGNLDLRNNPMPFVQLNRVPIEFGDGTVPPTEFFVHGQDKKPLRALGCNIHDTCYQTCVPGEAQKLLKPARLACNVEQYGIHNAKCREAYPPVCPFTITGLLGNTFPDPLKCLLWLQEKTRCFLSAFVYFRGVNTFGGSAYVERQELYCIPIPDVVLK